MPRRSTTISLMAAVAIAACSDHNDPVGTNRMASGLHASPSGGISGSFGPAADLQLSGSASTGSPFTDSLFTYTFQVKNAGPDSAPHVTIVDTLAPTRATGELSGLWHYSSNVLATTPCAVGPFPGIGGYATCRYPAFQVSVLH